MTCNNEKPTTPKCISIVVPLYNGATSIVRCLDSILNQTYKQIEIIVIDDGSTDNSVELVSQYKNKIKLLRQENKGPAAARNLGIKQSTGKYLAFLDSDDFWFTTFLEKSITALTRFPESVAVSCATKAISWTGTTVTIPKLKILDLLADNKEGKIISDFFNFWAMEDHIRTGTVVINRKQLPANNLYQREDLRISEDLEYWGLLATYGNWVFLPEVLFVTDGTTNAATNGWLEKNRARRKQCPTVEQWQKRIIPRLQDNDLAGFHVMRGKIAGNFAHAKILVNDFNSAKDIVVKYGSDFKPGYISRTMNRGLKYGYFGWNTCCRILCLREWLKALIISVKHIA